MAEEWESIGTVLDYAGDRGLMMEGGPVSEHFVYEISGVSPVEGVTAITDPAELEGRVFDLVLLCGVVEHFSQPFEQVREIIRLVKPGGLLFVEVPDELFAMDQIPQGDWYRHWLTLIARRPWIRLAADFYSTATRVKLGRVPPLGFVKQHQHLNYFNARSLSGLLQRESLAMLSCAALQGAVVALCPRPIEA